MQTRPLCIMSLQEQNFHILLGAVGAPRLAVAVPQIAVEGAAHHQRLERINGEFRAGPKARLHCRARTPCCCC
jgi:hypothetical protein